MSRIDPELADEWAVDNALDADHDDPFAGDDPTDDYLAEVAKQRKRDHQRAVHSGHPCTCPSVDVPLRAEAPF